MIDLSLAKHDGTFYQRINITCDIFAFIAFFFFILNPTVLIFVSCLSIVVEFPLNLNKIIIFALLFLRQLLEHNKMNSHLCRMCAQVCCNSHISILIFSIVLTWSIRKNRVLINYCVFSCVILRDMPNFACSHKPTRGYYSTCLRRFPATCLII